MIFCPLKNYMKRFYNVTLNRTFEYFQYFKHKNRHVNQVERINSIYKEVPHHPPPPPSFALSLLKSTLRNIVKIKPAKLIMCLCCKIDSFASLESKYISTYHHSYIWYFLKPHQPWIQVVPLVEKVFLLLLLFPNQTGNKINGVFYLVKK